MKVLPLDTIVADWLDDALVCDISMEILLGIIQDSFSNCNDAMLTNVLFTLRETITSTLNKELCDYDQTPMRNEG